MKVKLLTDLVKSGLSYKQRCNQLNDLLSHPLPKIFLKHQSFKTSKVKRKLNLRMNFPIQTLYNQKWFSNCMTGSKVISM